MIDFPRLETLIRVNARTGLLPARLSNAPLDPSTTIADLGLDSLGMMTLLTALMEEADAYFSDDTFLARHTLADVVRICSEYPGDYA